MTLLHTKKYRRLASKHEASAGLCSSTRQFLIYSTFALVFRSSVKFVYVTTLRNKSKFNIGKWMSYWL